MRAISTLPSACELRLKLFCVSDNVTETKYEMPLNASKQDANMTKCHVSERGSAPSTKLIKYFGRLAQLVAHHIDVVGVTCSSHVSPTIKFKD